MAVFTVSNKSNVNQKKQSDKINAFGLFRSFHALKFPEWPMDLAKFFLAVDKIGDSTK